MMYEEFVNYGVMPSDECVELVIEDSIGVSSIIFSRYRGTQEKILGNGLFIRDTLFTDSKGNETVNQTCMTYSAVKYLIEETDMPDVVKENLNENLERLLTDAS